MSRARAALLALLAAAALGGCRQPEPLRIGFIAELSGRSAEGPIKKFKEGGTSVSYVLSAKKSLIDQTSKTLYSYAATDKDAGLPFFFQDLYGKLSVNTSNGVADQCFRIQF